MGACLQNAWGLLQAVLLSEKAVKAPNVRASLVLAHRLRQGWLPLSGIVSDPAVRCLNAAMPSDLRSRNSDSCNELKLRLQA